MHSSLANTLRTSRQCGKIHCEIDFLPTIEQQSDWDNSVNKILKKHLENFSNLSAPKLLFPSLYPEENNRTTENDDDHDHDDHDDISDGLEFEHVSKQDAFSVIEMLYTKDLAYNAVLRSSPQASKLASAFIDFFENSQEEANETIYYSNSRVNKGRICGLGGNLTMATFDSGVFAVNKKYFGFLVIEDED